MIVQYFSIFINLTFIEGQLCAGTGLCATDKTVNKNDTKQKIHAHKSLYFNICNGLFKAMIHNVLGYFNFLNLNLKSCNDIHLK